MGDNQKNQQQQGDKNLGQKQGQPGKGQTDDLGKKGSDLDRSGMKTPDMNEDAGRSGGERQSQVDRDNRDNVKQ